MILLGALILFAYPLHGDYLKEVQDKVLEMHAEKKMKLDQNKCAKKFLLFSLFILNII